MESEVCTEKSRLCSDSRVGPEKHRWVTVWLQVRASQHKCSTLCTVIDEIDVNPLFSIKKISNPASDMQVPKTTNQINHKRCKRNVPLINENQRLRHAMGLNGCAAVQRTSRVSWHNPGIHAVSCAFQSPTATARSWTCFPRPPSRESRGASTAARPREHHKIQRCSPCKSYIGPSKFAIQLRKLILAFLFQLRRCEKGPEH